MENRNRLRQIKKQIIHRKIQPKRGTIIEQDFYRHIVIKHTNNKTRQRTKNNTKTKRNSKIHLRISSQHQHTHRRNQISTTKTPNRQPRRNTKVIKAIMEISSKELVATKILHEHMYKEIKKLNKNCKTSKSQGFEKTENLNLIVL